MSHVWKLEPMDAGSSLPAYLAANPKLAELLGTADPGSILCKEIGDGNLNFIFQAEGPKSTLIVKQSLPYIRCVGEHWPLSPERAFFEHETMAKEAQCCPQHVPKVFHFDRARALIVMRFVQPPHTVLRKALIARNKYEHLASHLSTFLAQTLFHTSALALSNREFLENVEKWSRNSPMCELTEQVVFTEPFIKASNNRWTSPQLDGDVAALQSDTKLILAVEELKKAFKCNPEALIHGDLHTGSVMVPCDNGEPGDDLSSFVIDPEFGFCGPMGFDVGAVVGNLLLSFYSQPGHGRGQAGKAFQLWILDQVKELWSGFCMKFLALWKRSECAGSTNPLLVSSDGAVNSEAKSDMSLEAKEHYLDSILKDTLGFAGCEMIRRVVGIAHVEDLDSIPEADQRAACERAALRMGRRLVVERRGLVGPAGARGLDALVDMLATTLNS